MRLSLLLLVVTAATARAQTSESPPATLSAPTRDSVLDGLLDRLDRLYVFPEKAQQMREAITIRRRRGEYEQLTAPAALADSLTAHLQAVTRDKHLRVRFLPNPPVRQQGPNPAERERARAENYGITARVLDGNVGYLELRSFGFPPAVIEESVAQAMTQLAGTDALIIDIRRNGGGSPGAVRLVSSYLFGRDSVHLNSLYFRPENRTDHFWTAPDVRGPRYGAVKPVYVLTSNRTFSAAEEFAYNLQSRRRAAIVGETTGGGAHPGGMHRLTTHFFAFIPSGRAINPVTGTNWEGTGVVPEIAAPADSALDAALRAIRTRR